MPLMIKNASKFYLPGNVFKVEQGTRKNLSFSSQYTIFSIVLQFTPYKVHNVTVNYGRNCLFS